VLTTYAGQKALLRDALRARAAAAPWLGEPATVDTVDRFQGSQADFVLLSLVRTSAVGHLRDVRRLVVALSRARLGLYVFARAALFCAAPELAPAFALLAAAAPAALELVIGERAGAPSARAPGASARDAAAASGGALTVVAVRDAAHLNSINCKLSAIQAAVAAAAAAAAGAPPAAPAPEPAAQ